MDNDEKSRRLTSAIHEIEEVLIREDIVIFINDSLEDTVREIDEYVKTNNLKVRDSISRKHAADLLRQLKGTLN